MKPGRVVRFRMLPKDCISVLDLAEKLNVDGQNKSFNSLCHIVMAGLLETLRNSGEIPAEQDQFEYGNRMAPFSGSGVTMATRAVSESLPRISLGKPKIPPEDQALLEELDKKENKTEEEQLLYNSLCDRYF